MDLFSRTNLKAYPTKVKQVKTWIAEILNLIVKKRTLIKMSKHTIFVCSSCAFSPQKKDYLEQRDGQCLLNQLKALQANWQLKDEFIIQEVSCMSACNRPYAVAFAAPNKTTLMFGDLPPMTSPPSLLRFAEQYLNSNDGLIKRQNRPEVLQKGILARIPPLTSFKDSYIAR